MVNTGLNDAQAGIKIAGRNINNLRYADDTILMVESEEELKSLMMKVKDKSEKTALKLNIRWKSSLKGRGYMYTYGWFRLRFDRKQQNSAKQLSINKKNNFLKKLGGSLRPSACPPILVNLKQVYSVYATLRNL